MPYILEFDDFCENGILGLNCDRRDLLFKLKEKIPQLKVNLFTIVGRCSPVWLEEIKEIPWVDMIPHGWSHDGPECQNWTKLEALDCLDRVERLGLTKGFKAPGWRISGGTYEGLMEKGYWVADVPKNDNKRPAGLRTYLASDNPEERIQGHMTECLGDRGLEHRFDFYASLNDKEYMFIKEIM